MRIAGKVALVTGVAGGIGTAICRTLAREGADLSLVWHRRGCDTLAEEIRALGRRVILTQADVVDAKGVQAALDRTVEDFGRLDVLVNNAGMAYRGSVEAMPEEAWDRILAVNLKSVFLFCRAAIPVMRRQGGGAIINMGSVLGKNGGNARPWLNPAEMDRVAGANYAASKAAIHCFTKTLAKELAASGITVNAVAPGPIETEMTTGFPEELRQAIPLGRMGLPEEVAGAVLYLASPEARFVTGEILDVNGGLWMD